MDLVFSHDNAYDTDVLSSSNSQQSVYKVFTAMIEHSSSSSEHEQRTRIFKPSAHAKEAKNPDVELAPLAFLPSHTKSEDGWSEADFDGEEVGTVTKPSVRRSGSSEVRVVVHDNEVKEQRRSVFKPKGFVASDGREYRWSESWKDGSLKVRGVKKFEVPSAQIHL